MKNYVHLSAALVLAAATSAVSAQPVQQFDYPSAQGSASPPSTLRITETPSQQTRPPVQIRDTPESISAYERCRMVSDRAATTREEMSAGAAQCLRELETRRQAQRR